MKQTTGICLLLVTISMSAPAMAADEEVQARLYLDLDVPLDSRTKVTLEASPRYLPDGDQLSTRAALEYKLDDTVTLNGGASYVFRPGGNEFRPHQQIALKFGALSIQTRLEERFFDHADRMELRIRPSAHFTVPVSKASHFQLSAEYLYILRSRDEEGDAHTDSYRARAVFHHRFTPDFDAGVGLLLIYSPKSGSEDEMAYVPQLAMRYRL